MEGGEKSQQFERVSLSSLSVCSSLLESSQNYSCFHRDKEKVPSCLYETGCPQHDAEHILCLRLALLCTSLEDFCRRSWINTHFAFVLPFGGFLLKH